MTIPAGKPKLKLLTVPILDELQRALGDGRDLATVGAWADQLLRVCELRLRELPSIAPPPQGSATQQRHLLAGLCLFFLDWFHHSDDPRFVNIVLRIHELRWFRRGSDRETKNLRRRVDDRIRDAVGTLEDAAWAAPAPTLALDRVVPAPTVDELSGFRTPQPGRPSVVILSPSPFSLYTLATAELLVASGFQLRGIVFRRLWSVTRLRGEFRRDRWVLLRKILTKLILRRRAYDPAAETPARVLERQGVDHGSIQSWAAEHTVPVRRCGDFNDPSVIGWIEGLAPEYVVFTGGGIVRDDLLDVPRAGVLNCHMGMLPRYRGMDVVEWPLLEGHPGAVGMCVHLMSRGLDEGDIVRMYRVDPHADTSIRALRTRIEARMPLAMLDGLIALADGRLEPLPQAKDDGRQYFRMHPRLKAIAEAHRRPSTARIE